jgi:two-component sensor histidine kinase
VPHRGESCESFFGGADVNAAHLMPFASVSHVVTEAMNCAKPVEGSDILIERPTGSVARAVMHIQPVKDEHGAVIGTVNCFLDVTDQHNDRHWADERHKTMVDELNHRVKNTLATVQSLAAQTLRSPRVPKDVRIMFEARLFALSRTHDHLTRAHWKSIDLSALAEEIFTPYRYLGHNRIRVQGASIAIAAHAAITLGMILHELVSNAAKYGALLGDVGHVDVSWSLLQRDGNERNGGQRLLITWQEMNGPAIADARGRGFGSRLLESGITQGLKGVTQLTFDPAGLRCVIDVPLAMVQEQRALQGS